MRGRAFVLILCFWAVLMVVTPALIKLSATAKLNGEFYVVVSESKRHISLGISSFFFFFFLSHLQKKFIATILDKYHIVILSAKDTRCKSA